MSVIISSEILLILQWSSRSSISASSSLGSNLSSMAFLGPRARVCITYLGGGVSSPHTTTVLLTWKRGRSCSIDSVASLLLWTSFCCRLVLSVVRRVYITTEGSVFSGTTALNCCRFSSNVVFRAWKSVLAFCNSLLRSRFWKLWMLLSSKQPLLGILNLRNFGITSARLQFSRNLIRRLLHSTLHRAFWYCRYCFQQQLQNKQKN